MSTRCNIIINKDKERIWLYHHCDGYPEYMGCVLRDYINKLDKLNPYAIFDDLIFDKAIDDGFEATIGLHFDIEYLYLIDTDKRTVECYMRRFGDGIKCNLETIIKPENKIEDFND